MKPCFYYDEACPFCCRCAQAWKQETLGFVDFQPLQTSDYALDRVVFVNERGLPSYGIEAVMEMFAYNPKRRWLSKIYFYIPFFDRIFVWIYQQLSSCRECADTFGWVFYGRKK